MARKKSNKVKTKSTPKSKKIQYSSDLDALNSFLKINKNKDHNEQDEGSELLLWGPTKVPVKNKMPFLDSFYGLRNWIMVVALLILGIGVIFNDGLMIILSLVVFFGWAMLVADFLHYNKRDK